MLCRYDTLYDRMPGHSAGGDAHVQRVHHLSLHNMSLDQAAGGFVPL